MMNVSIVTEVLPDGFEYMHDSYTGANPPTYHTTNNTLVMFLAGEYEITETYTVYAGTFGQIVNARFTGTYQSFWDGDVNGSVTGDDTLTAAAVYAESVARELPGEPVNAGESVTVKLTQEGSFCDASTVSEILPDGFEYVPGSYTGGQDPIYYTNNNTLVMVLGGDEITVEYTVSAGTFEQIDNAVFTGTYWGFVEGPGDAVTGDDTLTAATAYAESVVRDLPETASPGEAITVKLTQEGFLVNVVEVTETLPTGFKYKAGSFTGDNLPTYHTNNNTLVMYLAKEDEITETYTVTAGTFEQIDTAVFIGVYRGFGTTGAEKTGDVTGDDTLAPAEQPTPPPHDLNGDGKITSADALIALQMACGNCAPDENADVSGDGKVTSLDALMLMQVASEQH